MTFLRRLARAAVVLVLAAVMGVAGRPAAAATPAPIGQADLAMICQTLHGTPYKTGDGHGCSINTAVIWCDDHACAVTDTAEWATTYRHACASANGQFGASATYVMCYVDHWWLRTDPTGHRYVEYGPPGSGIPSDPPIK